MKKISADIEDQEAIKNDIDYHKPKIEVNILAVKGTKNSIIIFQRRAKAYADEIEKLNENCKKSVEKTQRQFVNIFS